MAKAMKQEAPEKSLTFEERWGLIEVEITGSGGLLMGRMSEASQEGMKRKQTTGVRQSKDLRNYEAECIGSMHVIGPRPKSMGSLKGLRLGLPAIAWRHCLVSGAAMCGRKKTEARASVMVLADKEGLVEMTKFTTPVVRVDPVVRSTGSSDFAARAFIEEWSCSLRIRFDTKQVSMEEVVQWLWQAGVAGGMGAWRLTTKKGIGQFGGFTCGNVTVLRCR